LLKPILKEQAKVNQILRGFGRLEDLELVKTVEDLKQSFPNYTKNIKGVALEILQETLVKRLG
jgi:hypothetical protein